jgi:hypothetical protein
MACACTHGLRLVTKYTVCLDIFYNTFSCRPPKKANDEESDRKPLLSFEGNDNEASINTEQGVKSNEGKTNKQGLKTGYIYLCFFVAGIALNLTWGSISFIVPYWLAKYGNDVWRDFVVCYNVPGFPVLLIQLFTDEKASKWFGVRKAYLVRLGISFTMVAALAGMVPYSQYEGATKTNMLVFVIVVGAAVGLGHGWIFSIATLYPPLAVAYLTAGAGMATVLLLILTLSENFPTNEDLTELSLYFEPVCILAVIGVFFCVSLLFIPSSVDILKKVDDEGNEKEAQHSKPTGEENVVLLKHEKNAEYPATGHIAVRIWSPLASIFLTIFTLVAAVTLIANIPSATNNPKFPVYILYVTSIASFVGNEIAVYLRWVAKKWPLFILACFRVLIFAFILVYSVKQLWLNDLFILTVLALFGSSGAFCISKCYSLCSASVSAKEQAPASNWLNICLYLGIYLGLAFPYLLPLIS